MRPFRSYAIHFVLISLVVVGGTQFTGLLAQGTTGSILGVVQDESQAVLPGVTITATNMETNLTRTVITDDEGRYRHFQLPLGPYEVRVELEGFNTEVRGPISLTLGREAVMDVTLTVGGIEERVVVTGEAPLVSTTSAVTAGLVDAKKIRDLPLNGRDFIQLALLQEGVVTSTKILRSQAGNSGIPLSLAGTRVHQSTFLLDGTDIRGSRGTVPAGVGGQVSGVESVKEFKVITGAFSAEYGRFTGGVITAVTKSGTNEVHGSIYEFHRNSVLDARNFFDRDPVNFAERSDVPEFKRNQFGFSIGGPIVRDRTFIFGSFEGLRERLSETHIANVPSEAARAGQFVAGFFPPPGPPRPVPVSPDMQPYIDLIPRPNDPDRDNDGIARFISVEDQPTDQELFNIRIDHEFSDSDSFFARYTLDQSNKQIFESHQTDLLFDYRYQYLTISERHIFSPTVINELRFGFTRSKANQTGMEKVSIDPAIRFTKQEPPLLGRFFSPFDPFGNFLGLTQVPNNFSYSNDLSWARGSHFFKIGAHLTRMQFNGKVDVRTNGLYVFTSVAEFLLGRPLFFDAFSTQSQMVGTRENIIAFYFQDDWKFSPRLTINMGLRYEFITGPNEVGTGESVGFPEIEGRVANLISIYDSEQHIGNPFFDNPSLKNFSPRIGFAWDPFGNGKTSVRGGYGVFFDQLTTYLFGSAQVFNPPFQVRIRNFRTFGPFSTFAPIGPGNDPFETASSSPNLWAMGDVKQPYIMQYSLTIQQEVMPNTVVTLAYQGSQGRKLPRLTNDINLAVPVKYDAGQYPNGPGPEHNGRTYFPFCMTYAADGSCFQETGARAPGAPGNLPARNPNFSTVRMELWDGNSNYNAVRIGLARRFSSGLQFQFAYNFSRAIDESSNTGHSDANGGRGENSAWSVVDPDDKATMRGLSSNHVAQTFSANFTYELPFNPSGAVRHILGDWQINGIVTAATGPATSFSIDLDQAKSGQGSTSQRPELVPGTSNNPVLHGGREPEEYYDVSNFVLPEEGFFGNVGRNTLIAPGIVTFDFGLSKSFTVNDQTSIQFRTEVFNLFNRANFTLPAMNVWDSGPTRDSTAGEILTTTTTSRQIQFALKILF